MLIRLVKSVLRKCYHFVIRSYSDGKRITFRYLFSFCRVKDNKVVFINEDYSCNPKAIAEEIIRRGVGMKLIWLSDYTINDIPNSIKLVTKSGVKGAYHLSTARIIVMNSKGDFIRYSKKRKQYLIQTHHGSFPLKYVEAECEEKLPEVYVKYSKIDSKMTDLMLSDSAWTSQFCRHALWYNGEILESGYPRNDIYFNWNDNDKQNIRKELGLDDRKRIVTYAPTFRDNGDFSCYCLDANLLLDELKQKTGEDWTLLVRAHPNIFFLSGKSLDFEYSDSVRDVTSYPDAQRLFLLTDLLITDYSSIMIDFMLMHKPVLLFATDEQEYVAQRGIRPEYYKLPFPHCKNNVELGECLKDLDLANPYSDDFMKWYGSKDDGHAAKRVVDRIITEMSIN